MGRDIFMNIYSENQLCPQMDYFMLYSVARYNKKLFKKAVSVCC